MGESPYRGSGNLATFRDNSGDSFLDRRAGVLSKTDDGVNWTAAGAIAGYSQDLLAARTSQLLGGALFTANYDELAQQTLLGWSVAGGAIAGDLTHPTTWSFVNTNTTIMFKAASPTVVLPQTTPWHIAGRIKFVTAIGAGEVKAVSLDNNTANGSVRVGLNGPVSTVKFCFTLTTNAGVAVTALSTVNLDITNFHVVELWFDGVNVWGSVDGEAPVLVGVAANLPSSACFERTGVFAAAGAAVGMFVDFTYAAAQRTAT